MRKNFARVACAAVALAAITASSGRTQPQPRRAAWEYTAISVKGRGLEEMNRLGGEGWELVALQSEPLSGLTLVFKRPK